MCDSYVVMSNVSAIKSTVLAKNSDRPSFDCQPLVYHEAKCFEKEKLELAYVTIDQAAERYATIGSSPYWCWGYEEGINEYGVAIGNEAVYTKDLNDNKEAELAGEMVQKGLLGMEFVRLGLERGKTAEEALHVITDLVEKYGQWGSGVPMSDTIAGSYNNSYIVADKKEAYILETAGKRWAMVKVEEGYAAISNELSIRTTITEKSPDLIEHAKQRGWCKDDEIFDFARAYINPLNSRQVSHIRVQRIRQLLAQAVKEKNQVSLEWMKRILRDHYEDTFLEGPYFNASSPDFLTICMHHSQAGFTWGNTASSTMMILPEERDKLPIMWWAPGVPCCSIYLPIFIDAHRLPECLGKAGTYGKTMCAPSQVSDEDKYQEGSFWWEIRSLLEEINGDEDGSKYEQRHAVVRALFDELEVKWMLEVEEVEAQAVRMRNDGNIKEMQNILYDFTEKCVNESLMYVQKARNIFKII